MDSRRFERVKRAMYSKDKKEMSIIAKEDGAKMTDTAIVMLSDSDEYMKLMGTTSITMAFSMIKWGSIEERQYRERIGEFQAIYALIGCVDDPNKKVRNTTRDALRTITGYSPLFGSNRKKWEAWWEKNNYRFFR